MISKPKTWPKVLLDPNDHPERSILYVGGLVLRELRRDPGTDLLHLSKKIDICSLKTLMLAVDWLYVIGLVELYGNGTIIRSNRPPVETRNVS